MKTRILTVTVGIAVTLSLGSRADVNMREGSFVETAIDLQLPTKNGPLELARTYSSRSLHQGLFGKGWCTELERGLRRIDDIHVAITDCRFDGELVYSATTSKLRKPAALDRTQYVATQRPGETLTLQDGIFTLKSQDGSTLRFDRHGRLVLLKNAKGLLVQVERDDLGLPKSLNGVRLTVDRATHLVSQIKPKAGRSVLFRYRQGHLIEAGSVSYSYDDDGNLIRVTDPTRANTVISYDSARDWVVRVRRKTCVEDYQYSKFTDDWFRSTLQRECLGQPKQQITYDFYQKAQAGGARGLEKVIIRTALKTVTLEWGTDAKLVRETKIENNDEPKPTGVVNVLE